MSAAIEAVSVDITVPGQEPALPLSTVLAATSTVVIGRSCVLYGLSLYNGNAATTATIELYGDGQVTDPAYLTVVINGKQHLWLTMPPRGLLFSVGLWAKSNAGAITAGFWYRYATASGVIV